MLLDHGVEDDEELAGDGDEDDLSWLTGIEQSLCEGFEGGVFRGVAGGEEEQPPDP